MPKRYVLLWCIMPTNGVDAQSYAALAYGTAAQLKKTAERQVKENGMFWCEKQWEEDTDGLGRTCYWRNAADIPISREELFGGDFDAYSILEVKE